MVLNHRDVATMHHLSIRTGKYSIAISNNFLTYLSVCRMFVFGGNDIRVGTLNNLWYIDMSEVGDMRDDSNNNNNLEWREVKTHGSTPG